MRTTTSTDKKSEEKQKLTTIMFKYSFQQIAKTPARMTKIAKVFLISNLPRRR